MPPVGAACRADFRRDHRLLDGKQFKAVFDRRQRHHGSFYSLHLLPNDLNYHRLGLAVSKKVSKKAVERNRIKRQVRESFRHLQQTTMADQQNLTTNSDDVSSQSTNKFGYAKFDCVVVAKPAAAHAENKVLSQELSRLWTKAFKG